MPGISRYELNGESLTFDTAELSVCITQLDAIVKVSIMAITAFNILIFLGIFKIYLLFLMPFCISLLFQNAITAIIHHFYR